MFQFLRGIVLIAVVVGIISLLIAAVAHFDMVSDLAACASIEEAEKRLTCFNKAADSSLAVDVVKRVKKADEKSSAVIAPYVMQGVVVPGYSHDLSSAQLIQAPPLDLKNKDYGAVLGAGVLSSAPDAKKVATQAVKATAYSIEANDRAAYRERLDRAFLEAGINMGVSVSIQGKQKIKGTDFVLDDGIPPTLVFFGYMDRASVYKIITTMNVIDEAKKLGFMTVKFSAKGSGGDWIFDLSKSAPVCSRGLCF